VKNELDFFASLKPNATPREANKFIQCRLIPRIDFHNGQAIAQNKKINLYFTGLPQENIGP
jgi:hypothetical protein